ncbi:MAG: hypothetical protein DCC47_16455 [Acidobacteria bacterium]|nr:MAG: hypothetical protein DCC47_16455 [Acidobacteriota bacterium]
MTYPSLHPAPAAEVDSSRRAFRRGFTVGVAAALAVGALVTGVVLVVRNIAGPDSFTVGGTMTLQDGFTPSSATQFDCEGEGGCSDMSPAAAVTVSDQSGTLLAKDRLDGSIDMGDSCIFTFAVADVPRGAAFYEVEISHRGGISFTESEAEDGISLSLGD